MSRGTRIFWLLIAALLGAAVFFGIGAEERRPSLPTPERAPPP